MLKFPASMNSLQLPAEVWTHIFAFLSTTDKLSVRASCVFFRKLVDRGCLWKNSTVFLDFKSGRYNTRFWSSLRRRKVSSVVVSSVKQRDWRQLAVCLPALTTIVMDRACQSCIMHLKDFHHLKRLSVRSRPCDRSTVFQSLPVSQLNKLTHLSMCGVTFPFKSPVEFQSTFSQFAHLTSLSNHCTGLQIFKDAESIIHCTVSCLPQLEHLSLCLLSVHGPSDGVDQLHSKTALSSLELVNCSDVLLTEDMMKTLPGLRNLTVFYNRSDKMQWKQSCHLQTWLCDLSNLSSLVVVNGPHVKKYGAFIPATVTTLGLYVCGLSSEEMNAVALQVPNLLHLHMVPWPSVCGAQTTDLSQLFPKLRSVKIYHLHVPEKFLLKLSEMKNLEHLEILDDHPDLSKLVIKLKMLTNHRLRITIRPSSLRDAFLCSCSEKVEQFGQPMNVIGKGIHTLGLERM
uniref:F-box domain-containing protein n=1 Tax=Gouania willdenowi TaxID=441366 RepID=A0A8C5DZZ1_GOUWI